MSRPLAAALAFALALAAPGAHAQPAPAPPPMFASADEQAARASVDRYFAAFSAGDFDTVRRLFNAPFLFGGRRMRTVATVEEVVEAYRSLRAGLDREDYAVSKAAEVRILPLSGDSALAQVHWVRLKKGGGLHSEGAEVMLLAKVDGEWKITGNLPEDLRQFRAAAPR